jgi:hypothetical protein
LVYHAALSLVQTSKRLVNHSLSRKTIFTRCLKAGEKKHLLCKKHLIILLWPWSAIENFDLKKTDKDRISRESDTLLQRQVEQLELHSIEEGIYQRFVVKAGFEPRTLRIPSEAH